MKPRQRSTTPGVPRFMVRVRTNSTVLEVHSVRMQFGSWVVWLGTCMGGDSTPCGAKVACHSGVFSSCATTSAIAARRMVRRRKGGAMLATHKPW